MRPGSRSLQFVFLLGALLLFAAACARPLKHTLRLRPHPVGEKGPSTGLVVGLVPFKDARPDKHLLGKRITSGGKEEQIRLDSPAPAEDVTYILRRSLKGRNIRVVELSDWVPEVENLDTLPQEVDVVIAGTIEALEVQATSTLVKTTVQYHVRLSAYLGFKEPRKVIRRQVEITPEETLLSFDRDKIENSLNEAVASALQRLIDVIFSPLLESS